VVVTSAILAVTRLLFIVGICVSYLLLAFGFWVQNTREVYGSFKSRGWRLDVNSSLMRIDLATCEPTKILSLCQILENVPSEY
jgi:hypothetical protein